MAFDLVELHEHIEKRRKEKLIESRSTLTSAAMAVAPMEILTADPKWDALLQTAQAEQEGDGALLSSLIQQLHDDRCVEPSAIMMLKIGIARVEGRIEGRTRVMALPKAMIEAGQKAANALKELRDA